MTALVARQLPACWGVACRAWHSLAGRHWVVPPCWLLGQQSLPLSHVQCSCPPGGVLQLFSCSAVSTHCAAAPGCADAAVCLLCNLLAPISCRCLEMRYASRRPPPTSCTSSLRRRELTWHRCVAAKTAFARPFWPLCLPAFHQRRPFDTGAHTCTHVARTGSVSQKHGRHQCSQSAMC